MGILGIDEVGRGPWAGPLVIGAVILPKDEAGNYPDWVADLTDSKKLSPKKREALSAIILREAPATGLGWVSAKEVDELGLAESLRLATRRAVEAVQKQKVLFTEIIIDGTQNFLKGTKLENHVTTLKKGDLLIKEISAASIIAKVARDHYMVELAEQYPDYGFEKHVGYGTKLHSEMLAKFGPCPEHRRSFGPVASASGENVFRRGRNPYLRPRRRISLTSPRKTYGAFSADQWNDVPAGLRQTSTKTFDRKRATTTEIGRHAEDIIAKYLINNNHTIVARNHKTKFYEIDIVSTKDDKIYFTEIKYRKNSDRGTPLDMVTKEKLQKMTFAAEAFLKYYKDFQSFSPLLAAGLVSGSDFTLDSWLVLN